MTERVTMCERPTRSSPAQASTPKRSDNNKSYKLENSNGKDNKSCTDKPYKTDVKPSMLELPGKEA